MPPKLLIVLTIKPWCQRGVPKYILTVLAYWYNDLSKQLEASNTSCLIGNTLVSHIMYADDLAVLSPSSAVLLRLITILLMYVVKCRLHL